MGVIESVRGVLWARRRQPDEVAYGVALGHERFSPALADGIWTLADPQKAPPVIAAYRRAAEDAGREPGEVILQGLASWAEDDDAALNGAREWKGTLVHEHLRGQPAGDAAHLRRARPPAAAGTLRPRDRGDAPSRPRARSRTIVNRHG